MTSRQKTVLWRWVLSVVVISSLLFLIPEYIPNLLPKDLSAKETWISLNIHSESEIIPLKIKHQFIDPLILGLITWLIGRFCISMRPSKIIQIVGGVLFLGALLSLAHLIFYQLNGNTFVILFLTAANIFGPILKWGSVGLCIVWAFHFFILGIEKYFQDDRENERLRVKEQNEEPETTCQNTETSD